MDSAKEKPAFVPYIYLKRLCKEKNDGKKEEGLERKIVLLSS